MRNLISGGLRWGAALLVFLAGLELCLALLAFGARETRAYRARRRRSMPRAELTVLCEGDSFTWGIGGRSYPEQLQEILRERSGKDCEVVNAGVPGRTSREVLESLEEDILAVRPDVVILVMGMNNNWNSVPPKGLKRLRLWRLVQATRWSLSRLRRGRRIEEETDRLASAAPAVQRSAALARASLARGRFGEADRHWEQALAALPPQGADEDFYRGINGGFMSFGRCDLAVKYAERGLKRLPLSEKLFDDLSWCRFQQDRVSSLRDYAARNPGVRANPRYRSLDSFLRGSSGADRASIEREILGGLSRDAAAAVLIAARHGVVAVMGSYPEEGYRPVEEAARLGGATYVDFTRLFRARFKRRSDYISEDFHHVNTQGYRLMAESFADVIARLRPAHMRR